MNSIPAFNSQTLPVDFELICEAVDVARARIATNSKITEAQRGDWIRAIAKAFSIFNGVDLKTGEPVSDPIRSVEFDEAQHAMIFRDEAGEVKYVANGVCQCKAFSDMTDDAGQHHACYHRAMARIFAIHQELVARNADAALERAIARLEEISYYEHRLELASYSPGVRMAA